MAGVQAAAPMQARRRRCCAPPRLLSLLALLAVASTILPSPVAAAPLPLHLRWLSSLIPPSAAGPALRDFFQALPKELCGMGPDGLAALPSVIMDEVGMDA
jgi:hypothetical protein